MYKIWMLLFALSIAHAQAVYTVDTDRSGYSSVTLSMEGTDALALELPPDAGNFRIVGGSYEIANQTAVVSAGKAGFTTFSFSTALFTTKTQSGWKLSFSPPENATVRIYMPAYSTIENAFPQPKRVSSEDSRISVESGYSPAVTLYYSLGEVPPEEGADPTGILLVAAIIAVAVIALSFLLRPKPQTIVVETKDGRPVAVSSAPPEKAPTLGMTPGKKEMMETFNENDLKIVGSLLSSDGKSRRNELERRSGISKSSLAMALNRLEKRKIIEIDRTSTTHFVKLSDYFLKL